MGYVQSCGWGLGEWQGMVQWPRPATTEQLLPPTGPQGRAKMSERKESLPTAPPHRKWATFQGSPFPKAVRSQRTRGPFTLPRKVPYDREQECGMDTNGPIENYVAYLVLLGFHGQVYPLSLRKTGAFPSFLFWTLK